MDIELGELSHPVKPQEAAASARWQRLRVWLWPLEGGRNAIPALDGLRALAALSVVIYHTTATAGTQLVINGNNLSWLYFYGQSGVDLFFVLSGFLLFLPYVRAILANRPNPNPWMFYRRRALRILPAYYVCLVVIASYETWKAAGPTLPNIILHLFLLHDMWPAFNRTISGPFWTLAVEWQFYLILPWAAWLIRRASGGKLWRLALGPVALIAIALGLRELSGQAETHWYSLPHGWAPWITWIRLILIGTQGKFLEVFAVGMLCAVAYVAVVERAAPAAQPHPLTPSPTGRGGIWWWIGGGLLVAAVASYAILGPLVYERRNAILAQWYLRLYPNDAGIMLGPLWLGLGYGALALGVLLGPAWARRIFSWRLLRFVGLISYSLYLWHETLISVVYSWLGLPTNSPQFTNSIAAFAIALFVAVPFAYLSYQFIERPFLKLR